MTDSQDHPKARRSSMLGGRSRGWALAATGMLLVSTDSLFIKLSEASSWDIAFLVGVFGVVTFGVLGLKRGVASISENLSRQPLPIASVAILGAVSHLAFISAVTNTAVANVVAIVAAAPLAAGVFGRLAFGERVEPRVWQAIIAVGIGIVVVVAGSYGTPTLKGDLLALVAIAAFGTSINIWRRFPDMIVVVPLAIGSALMLAVAAPLANPLDMDGKAWFWLAAMGFFFNPAGKILHASAARFAPAAEVALFAPVETIAAPIWVWLALDERPPTQTLVGGIVILAAVIHGTLGVTGLRRIWLRAKRAGRSDGVTISKNA